MTAGFTGGYCKGGRSATYVGFGAVSVRGSMTCAAASFVARTSYQFRRLFRHQIRQLLRYGLRGMFSCGCPCRLRPAGVSSALCVSHRNLFPSTPCVCCAVFHLLRMYNSPEGFP
jgi:hypothetical protein